MGPSANSVASDLNPFLLQSGSTGSALSIRPGTETKESIIRLLKDIESKVTIALGFFGVDTRFLPKFLPALRATLRPACIAAVSSFIALHLFPTIGISAIVGIVSLVHMAASRARLEIMKEDLEAAKQNAASIGVANQELKAQNAQLLDVNQQQVATLAKQKETIAGAQQNLETAKSELSAAQENLTREQQLKELQQQKSDAEIAQLGAQLQTQEQQIAEQSTYIAKCQDCLVSVFTSQQDLIHNLEQRMQMQTQVVQTILSNVQSIANGEQKLTEALSWAQGQISEAQSKLSEVISKSADMTDPAKCKEL
ncbi:MAG: hypothetical protein LBK24_01095, partial [Puniceicoccales bacterium]|nr:hypothetical protein [Puniceicoccales bacterium]